MHLTFNPNTFSLWVELTKGVSSVRYISRAAFGLDPCWVELQNEAWGAL
jgi:hypothetical protein